MKTHTIKRCKITVQRTIIEAETSEGALQIAQSVSPIIWKDEVTEYDYYETT